MSDLRALTIALLAALALPLGAIANDATTTIDPGAEIEYLLQFVRDSELVFVRNSKRYTGTEAAEHMERKYEHFRAEISTSEDFIRLAATRSLISGKAYEVIHPDGRREPTAAWLTQALAAHRQTARAYQELEAS